MRLSQKYLQDVSIFKPTQTKDSEGNFITSWEKIGELEAMVRPVSGQLDMSKYGARLPIVKRLFETSDFFQQGTHEGYGVSLVGGDEPAFKVVSIQNYTDHSESLIEKM